MPIIGYNGVGSNTFTWNNSLDQTLLDAGGTSPAAVTRTAVAGETVDTVYYYCNNGGYGGDSAGVDIGIYWLDGTTWRLEGSANIPGSLSTGWNSASTSISLTSGRTYAVALRLASATGIASNFNYESGATSIGTLTGTSALPTTWSENYAGGAEQSFYAETSITATGAALASDLSGSSSLTANLTQPADSLASALSSTSSLTANLTQPADQFAAALSSASSLTADLTQPADQLAASLSGSSSLTADLTQTADQLAAALTGSSILTANLTQPSDQFAADLSSTSSLTADLTLPAPQLASDLSGTSSISALFGFVTITYDGTSPTGESFWDFSQTDGDLGGGGFTAVSTDVLYYESHPDVTLSTDTTFIVNPAQTLTLAYKWFDTSAGTFTSESRVTITDLGNLTALAADLSSTSALAADLTTSAHQFAADLTSSSALTANLIVPADTLQADLASTSSLTADITQPADQLAADLSGVSALTADLTQPADQLAADLSGVSALTANLIVPNDGLLADLIGLSTLAADLTQPADQLSSDLTGSSLLTADLTIPGGGAILLSENSLGRGIARGIARGLT